MVLQGDLPTECERITAESDPRRLADERVALGTVAVTAQELDVRYGVAPAS